MPRKFKLKANDQAKCGSNVEFTAHSMPVVEACCEAHVV